MEEIKHSAETKSPEFFTTITKSFKTIVELGREAGLSEKAARQKANELVFDMFGYDIFDAFGVEKKISVLDMSDEQHVQLFFTDRCCLHRKRDSIFPDHECTEAASRVYEAYKTWCYDIKNDIEKNKRSLFKELDKQTLFKELSTKHEMFKKGDILFFKGFRLDPKQKHTR